MHIATLLFPTLVLGRPIPGSGTAAFGGAIIGAIIGSTMSSGSGSSYSAPPPSVTHIMHDNTGGPSQNVIEYYKSHDGWRSDVMVEYLYFTKPNDPAIANDTIIAIETPWYILYHKQLRRRLERNLGLKSMHRRQVEDGWFELAQVNAGSVWRGNIDFYKKAWLVDGAEVDTKLKPSEDLVDDISDIMVHMFPCVEIFLVIFFTVGLPVSTILLCCCAARSARRMR